MASATVDLKDFEAFRAQLEKLPEVLKAEALREAEGAAREMAGMVEQEYRKVLKPPDDSGNLLAGIGVRPLGATGFQVFNGSPHAALFEFGTVSRHTRRTGANRGVMPRRPVFIATAVRVRKGFYGALKAIVEKAGFTVSGDAR